MPVARATVEWLLHEGPGRLPGLDPLVAAPRPVLMGSLLALALSARSAAARAVAAARPPIAAGRPTSPGSAAPRAPLRPPAASPAPSPAAAPDRVPSG